MCHITYFEKHTDFDLKYAVPSSYKINNSWGWNVQYSDYS